MKNLKSYIKTPITEAKGDFAGWISIYNGDEIEIKKSEANDISHAKEIAIKKFKVPKSKQGLVAIMPAVEETKSYEHIQEETQKEESNIISITKSQMEKLHSDGKISIKVNDKTYKLKYTD